MSPLILKRGSVSRPSGHWNADDFDVFEGGVTVGRIYRRAARPNISAGFGRAATTAA